MRTLTYQNKRYRASSKKQARRRHIINNWLREARNSYDGQTIDILQIRNWLHGAMMAMTVSDDYAAAVDYERAGRLLFAWGKSFDRRKASGRTS